MMYRCSREKLTIAFLLLSTAFPLICSRNVNGIEGQSITLPCSYRVRQTGDITSMCWGRGSCPSSQCNDVLIWTDGHRVTQRSSDRYQLNDNLSRGQISLTISKASMSDAGTYCCRIEHHGWFNDEKINIRLNMEKAPTTTPPTTTPSTTRPPVRKTTPPPTTAKATTPPPTSVRTTNLPPTSKILSTPPPIPVRTTIIVPTEEETIETTTLPTAETATTPPPPVPGSTSAPSVITTVSSPPLSTVLHTTPTYTTYTEETTTEAQSLSTDPYVISDFSHEVIHPHEAFDHHHPRSALPSQPPSHSSDNGISDLFSGNITTVVKKESGMALHILITAICVSIIVLVAVSLLILKFRGKDRGHYLFGQDPNLELVNHAEASLSETDPEISQTVTLEVDKVDVDKPEL